jgi:cytochrome c553
MNAPTKMTAFCGASILAGLATLSTGASAEGDPANGKMLAQGSRCTFCHGVDGNARSTSIQVVPMLAGQPAAYLAQEMKNYAEGIRADTSRKGVMAKELRLLSERDYEDLAAY